MNSISDYLQPGLIGVFVLINVIAFIIMAYDKRKSMVGRGDECTPEGKIFFLAAAFGAIGVYTAMLLFRHKTRKWYFQFGIPLLILQNIVLMYQMLQILTLQTK